MSIDTLEIRRIRREELPLIRDLAPPDWNLNLEKMYGQHYGQPYFYPTVTMVGTEIAGTGVAMVHSNCAWIGAIIILSTSHVGLPIYAKMGFVKCYK
jgi:hypothetical protein